MASRAYNARAVGGLHFRPCPGRGGAGEPPEHFLSAGGLGVVFGAGSVACHQAGLPVVARGRAPAARGRLGRTGGSNEAADGDGAKRRGRERPLEVLRSRHGGCPFGTGVDVTAGVPPGPFEVGH